MDTISNKGKHGLAAGPAAEPQRADWTVDQCWAAYTPAQHAVWKTLYERQTQLLLGLACDAFADGMNKLPMSAERIPNFEELSETLHKATGWQVVAVPGLVPDDVFFDHLANRRFPSGNFIRGAHELDYLEEPDVFHDVFGHVPMLSIQSDSPNRIAFDLERVMRTHYRIDDFQEVYFVLDDLQHLLALANTEFAPYYERLDRGPSYQPGEVLPTDKLLSRGTGNYHRGRPRKP
jgi:phenylalanine-4-hydroxylase